MTKGVDRVLNVPFYSQYDSEGLDEEWKDKSCGILSLKMILAYHSDSEYETKELLETALRLGGNDDESNWYHSTLVKTAIHYGFTAWRRSWIPSQRDVDYFKGEGVDQRSREAWMQQLKRESIPVITDEIEGGNPLIVSASPNFSEEDKAHLLVLNGVSYKDNGDLAGFFYLDPYNRESQSQPQKEVALNTFKNNWTYRAVFVHAREDE